MPLLGSTEPCAMKRSGCSFSALRADVAADADQADFDAEPVHLVQRDRDRIACAVQFLGHVLEHVFDREIELRRAVLQLLADEVVHFEVVGREADHRVDDADVRRACAIDQTAVNAFWNR